MLHGAEMVGGNGRETDAFPQYCLRSDTPRSSSLHVLQVLPALPLGMAKDLTPACCQTMLHNILHYPAGTIPVTRVRDDEQYVG